MGFEKASEDKITEKIIGCAIEVHKVLGPGLLESAYEECLCYELFQLGLKFERQVDLPIVYKGVRLDCGYRMDLVVENQVIVEIKAVEKLLPIHEAQLLSYLKLDNKSVGLLLNFHSTILKNGLKRIVNNFQNLSASPHLGGENFLKVFELNGEKL
jgi:GxxExxY protein